LLAATARTYGLTIATRNERDFTDLGVRVVNPWLA
jgi:predicted nucleic acid-binding protein